MRPLVASEMSATYMSPCTNVVRSATPASRASLRECSTSSGVNSTPRARAPRLAAAMTIRPSPNPRNRRRGIGRGDLRHIQHLRDHRRS